MHDELKNSKEPECPLETMIWKQKSVMFVKKLSQFLIFIQQAELIEKEAVIIIIIAKIAELEKKVAEISGWGGYINLLKLFVNQLKDPHCKVVFHREDEAFLAL